VRICKVFSRGAHSHFHKEKTGNHVFLNSYWLFPFWAYFSSILIGYFLFGPIFLLWKSCQFFIISDPWVFFLFDSTNPDDSWNVRWIVFSLECNLWGCKISEFVPTTQNIVLEDINWMLKWRKKHHDRFRENRIQRSFFQFWNCKLISDVFWGEISKSSSDCCFWHL
jgi:hypothetical protein